MLIRVLREYLRPYYGPLALVLLLQLVANAAALYLPTLNARIIDHGVARGDTAVIGRLGAVMLGAKGAPTLGRDTMFAVLMIVLNGVVGIGLLIDITLVRTVLVPAAMAMIGNRIWWPSKPSAHP